MEKNALPEHRQCVIVPLKDFLRAFANLRGGREEAIEVS
jgi:hypothetical protein